jgi:hypothetical protein
MKRVLILALLLFTPLLVSAAGNETLSTSILSGEIHIYSPIEPGVKFVLGIDTSSSLTMEGLIVRIALWVMFLVVILGILDFTAFESDWVKYTISFAITLIMAITGVMGNIANIIFSITKTIQGWNRLWVILGVVAVLIILGIARKILTRQRRLSQANTKGTMAGAAIKGLIHTAETAAKEAK